VIDMTKRCAALLLLCAMSAGAVAAELPEVDIPASPAARRHGAETAAGVCLGCHNLRFVRYGDLTQLGFNPQSLERLRQGKDAGEALKTELTPDMLRDSFGLVPPDLSLMARARDGGPRYIYGLLTGFYQKPDGSVDNRVFPGVKMPDVLGISGVQDPVQRAALEGQARDVAAFLAWSADPHAGERRRLGGYVLAYLGLLTVMLYLSKRRIWQRLG
jgi:cytochrome c1